MSIDLSDWTTNFKASFLSGTTSLFVDIACPILMVLCFICGLVSLGLFVMKWRSGSLEGSDIAGWLAGVALAFVMGAFFAAGGGWGALISLS